MFPRRRTRNAWKSRPCPETLLREVYDLAKLGPTAANSSPARFVFVTSDEAQGEAGVVASGNNQAKIRQAPVTVIVGYDLEFPETMPRLFPTPWHEGPPDRSGGGRAGWRSETPPSRAPI